MGSIAKLRTQEPRLWVGLQGIGGSVGSTPPFINWMKQQDLSINVITVSGVGYKAGQALANGWCSSDYEWIDPLPAGTTLLTFAINAGIAFYTDATKVENTTNGLEMKMKWDGGSSVISVDRTFASLYWHGGNVNTATPVGNAVTGAFSDGQTGNIHLTMTLDPTAPVHPPTNIRLFKKELESLVDAGAIFDPVWLASVRQWAGLRFMDWQTMVLADSSVITFASTDVDVGTDIITKTGHGLLQDDVFNVYPTSGSTLTGGLSLNVPYYVLYIDVDSFQVALTAGGAAIDLTSTGSGTIKMLTTPVNYNQFLQMSSPSWRSYSQTNKRLPGGIPVALMVALANESGRPIQIQLPVTISDAAATSYATELRDGIDWSVRGMFIKVAMGNETWAFGQAAFQWMNRVGVGTGIGSLNSPNRWSGYRQAQLMQIFRTVFGEDSGNRWRGDIETQEVSASVTTEHLVGIDYYIANEAPAGTTVVKLFTYVDVAPYIGPFVNRAKNWSFTTTDVDTGADTITLTGHNLGSGARIVFTTSGALPSPLVVTDIATGFGYDHPYFVKNPTANTIQVSLTSGGAAIDLTDVGSGTSLVGSVPGFYLKQWADISQAYFNARCGESLYLADANFIWGSIAQYRAGWLAQLAVAIPRGLKVACYEGGSNFVAVLPLRDNNSPEVDGRSPGKLDSAFGFFNQSAECAQAKVDMYNQYLLDGCVMPNHFVDDGPHIEFGSFSLRQYIKDVWAIVYVRLSNWNQGL